MASAYRFGIRSKLLLFYAVMIVLVAGVEIVTQTASFRTAQGFEDELDRYHTVHRFRVAFSQHRALAERYLRELAPEQAESMRDGLLRLGQLAADVHPIGGQNQQYFFEVQAAERGLDAYAPLLASSVRKRQSLQADYYADFAKADRIAGYVDGYLSNLQSMLLEHGEAEFKDQVALASGYRVVTLLLLSFAWVLSTIFALYFASSISVPIRRLAETHPAEYPTTYGDMEFARLVKERTNGRITIEVYPGSQLGQEKAVIEQVQFGAIDLTRVSISPLAAFAPQMDALQMPYVYRDVDHMWRVLKGDIGKELLKSLEPSGFVGLGWYESGARSFYNSKRPVRTPADLKGLKIRVQESELMIGLVSAFGAVATPMAYGEVYSGLQTGVIDGAENNWPSYYSTSHYEVARYFTLDEHTRVPEIIIASKISMDRLSRNDQEILKQAAMDSIDYQRKQWDIYEKVSIDKVRAAGNIIIEIKDKAPWAALMAPIYAKKSPEIQKLIERIRAVK